MCVSLKTNKLQQNVISIVILQQCRIKCNFKNIYIIGFVWLPPPSGPAAPTQRPESVCERWRTSLIEHYGGTPGAQQYVPQCESDGQFRYTPQKERTADEIVYFNDKLRMKANCLSVQSSVTEILRTAGVWTRTGARFLEPDHMMWSNLHVSLFLPVCLYVVKITDFPIVAFS